MTWFSDDIELELVFVSGGTQKLFLFREGIEIDLTSGLG